MRVLVYGSLNIDYVYAVNHILKHGETETSDNLRIVAGGKGLNQAIALSKAGVKVFLAGQIGKEGAFLEKICTDALVDTSFLQYTEEKSGHAIIQVDSNGENTILLFGGANRTQKRNKIDEVFAYFEEGDYLLLQNEINELDYIIEKAYSKKMYIVLNPSPFDLHLQKCDLQKVSLFILNEIEGGQITGKSETTEIEEELESQFPHAEILLTLGTKGSKYFGKGKKVFFQECYKVNTVDTTGAGDTYTGYFVGMRMKGREIAESMRLASVAAGIACTRKGASVSIPEYKEVERIMPP